MKQQCPTLDLVLLDGHGHMLLLTAPDLTADLIRRVAARQLAARAAIAYCNAAPHTADPRGT